jgi:hypothetical protein
MSRGRFVFMLVLLVVSAGLGLLIVVTAARAGNFSGKVFFALLPFVMLGGIAWQALRGKND